MADQQPSLGLKPKQHETTMAPAEGESERHDQCASSERNLRKVPGPET